MPGAGKVCIPSTIPVSSNARNTWSKSPPPAIMDWRVVVGVLGLGVDGPDEPHRVAELRGPEDLLGGPHRVLHRQQGGAVQPAGLLAAPVDQEVVVGLAERLDAFGVLGRTAGA